MDNSTQAIKARLLVPTEQIRVLSVHIDKVEKGTPPKATYPMVDNLRTEKQMLSRDLRAERNALRELSRLIRQQNEKEHRQNMMTMLRLRRKHERIKENPLLEQYPMTNVSQRAQIKANTPEVKHVYQVARVNYPSFK